MPLKLFPLFICFPFLSIAQQIKPLYSGTIPNSTGYEMKEVTLLRNEVFLGYSKVSDPTIQSFLPVNKTEPSSAVIICPGGGYAMESYRLEGTRIAEEFQKKGIAAFVLKYRLPSDSIMVDKTIGPLQDAQQALLRVRQQAKELNIDPNKIGIMGFSAGGHLASTAGTHFEKSYVDNREKISLRPDFMVLIYPVISMQDSLTHAGSRNLLLGLSPTEKEKDLFSNELHITKNTPPTWLTHTGDDTVVNVENSIKFYQGLISNEVPAEMHLYPKGNHGFVLSIPTEQWMVPLFDWLEKSGF